MITNKKEFKKYLEADKKALGRTGKFPKYTDLVWKFEILLRKCEYLHNCKRHNIFYKPIYWFYRYKFFNLSVKCGFEIPLNAFGKGLSIAHRGNIVVNSGAKIGENCRIHVGVNIGTQVGLTNSAPIIGNNVYIAPGAKLFGEIEIADNIVIGANSVVNKSFTEKNIAIAGIPAKKISDKGTDTIKNILHIKN